MRPKWTLTFGILQGSHRSRDWLGPLSVQGSPLSSPFNFSGLQRSSSETLGVLNVFPTMFGPPKLLIVFQDFLQFSGFHIPSLI